MKKHLKYRSIKTGLFIIVPVILIFTGFRDLYAQSEFVDKKVFFSDSSRVEMTIVSDFRKLIREKNKKDFEQNYQPATITLQFDDSIRINGDAEVRPRGDFRREECYRPPIMINFKKGTDGVFKKMGRLKLVWPGGDRDYDEQLVLKEYLVYKIYEMLTDKAFRVRLVSINCVDAGSKMRSRIFYGFFIEDVDDLAKRNDCREIESVAVHPEHTNHAHTSMVNMFQYMIGNTDWAVSVYHNIKLIGERDDSCALPYVVPFDFDACGLVNADYAVPTAELCISDIRQRLYMGFERTAPELQASINYMRQHRNAFESLIMNFEPLSKDNKKEMISYLDEFFMMMEIGSPIEGPYIHKTKNQ